MMKILDRAIIGKHEWASDISVVGQPVENTHLLLLRSWVLVYVVLVNLGLPLLFFWFYDCDKPAARFGIVEANGISERKMWLAEGQHLL